MLATASVILFALALSAASGSNATRQEEPAFNLSETAEMNGTPQSNNELTESTLLDASLQSSKRTSKDTDSERLIRQASIVTQLRSNCQPFDPDLFITNSDVATTTVTSSLDRKIFAAAAALPQIAFAILVGMSPFYQTAISNLFKRITITPIIYLCLLNIAFVIFTSLHVFQAYFAATAKHTKSLYYLRQKVILAISGFFISAIFLALFNSGDFAQAGENGIAEVTNAAIMLGLEIGLAMLLHPTITGVAESFALGQN